MLRTTCCIAGGGPAGMMLGFLLARAGVAGVVLDHPQKEVLHIMEEMAAQASSLSGTEEYLHPQHLRARGQTEARVRQERT